MFLLRQMVFSTLSTEEISNSAVTISPQVPTAVILLELATNCSVVLYDVAGGRHEIEKIKLFSCSLMSENIGKAANSANTTVTSGTSDSRET